MYKSFFNKYKLDLIYLFALTLIFIILIFQLSQYLLNIFIDFGREVYFPKLMTEGKLLYKDLFNIFGPLGYQINAILYKLFGVNTYVLGIFGSFCSLLIIYFTYFISRFFLEEKLSFCLTLLVLTTCVFSPSVFNFIYPYSYSLLYSLTAFLGSLLFFLMSINKEKSEKYLLFSYFLIGISIDAKYEFVLFSVILFIYSIFVYKQKITKLILNAAVLLSVPMISYGYLFFQGVTLNDFVQNFYYIKNYIASESLCYFYKHSVGTIFSFDLFNKINLNDLIFAVAFIIFYLVICFVLTKYKKYLPKYLKPEHILFLTGFLFGFKWLYPRQIYFYIPYFLYGIFAYYLVKTCNLKNFNVCNKYFILLIVSIISMLKTAFILDVKIYGTFSIILPLISIIYFITEYIPKINSKILKSDIVNYMSVFILILTIITFNWTNKDFSIRSAVIKTQKANFYMHPIAAECVGELLNYINENISETQSIFILPEGAFINYITNRDMKLYDYYSMLPPHIETFGINKIIKDFKNAKIDYIVITPRVMDEYNINDTFCGNKNINTDLSAQVNVNSFCNFIVENYTLVKSIGDIYSFKIYKLR